MENTIWKVITQATEQLQKGELVGIPTETVYGLAGRIDHPATIENIFHLKARPFSDPLIIHLSSIEQLKWCTDEQTELTKCLAKAFWPGPLTILFPRKKSLSNIITSGHDFVAVRIPDHPFTLRIIKKLNVPLAAPSANKFGRTSPTEAQHVQSEFPNLFVVDGGPCEIGIESTVIHISGTPKKALLEILRPGFIRASELEKALKVQFPEIEIHTEIKGSAMSPGNVKKHYQPDVPLVLLSQDQEITDSLLNQVSSLLHKKVETYFIHSKNPSMQETLRCLYRDFRRVEKSDYDIQFFYCLDQSSEELQITLMDRVGRAATLDLRPLLPSSVRT
jgi:L-threonylcarbamoyladenylate synthase